MKKMLQLAITCIALSYCSNMKSDAEKAYDFTTQIIEMMPQMFDPNMMTELGDEN